MERALTERTQISPDYMSNFSEEILEHFKRYSAEQNAKFLLPRLRPGLSVIDVGCGVGAVSVGLAKAVEPGELHGVDADEAKVRMAQSIAEERQQRNAHFQVGDLLDLPFSDDSFDVAHCHNVLMYVPDTRAVFAEIRRVLRPGGIVACRELMVESCFSHPDFGILRRSWDMFEDILSTDGAHPQMGKNLNGLLTEAGFENIIRSASFDLYDTPEDVNFIYTVLQQWFLAPEIVETAVMYGAATQKMCDQIRNAYDRWKDHSGAFSALAWGEAIAVNP